MHAAQNQLRGQARVSTVCGARLSLVKWVCRTFDIWYWAVGPDYEILGRYALLKNGPNSADHRGAWVECLNAFFHDFSAEVTPPFTSRILPLGLPLTYGYQVRLLQSCFIFKLIANFLQFICCLLYTIITTETYDTDVSKLERVKCCNACASKTLKIFVSDHPEIFFPFRPSDGGPIWAAQGRGPVRTCVQCVTSDRTSVRETSLGTKVPLINDSYLMAAI